MTPRTLPRTMAITLRRRGWRCSHSWATVVPDGSLGMSTHPAT